MSTTPTLHAEHIGGYSELAARLGVKPDPADISCAPVVAVFLTAALLALVLAMLKLMDGDAFAVSFAKYDLLTQRWRAWGRLYPGIELLVGLGLLLPPEQSGPPPLVGAAAVPRVIGLVEAIGLGAEGMVRITLALVAGLRDPAVVLVGQINDGRSGLPAR